MIEPVRIFLCYSRKDTRLKDLLLEHLSSLRREGLATIWHDQDIDAGRQWVNEIDNRLAVADIVLLLISPSFLASDYCYSVELKQALKRNRRGAARTIPVLLRPVDTEEPRIAALQALPTNGVPVTQWADPDEAFRSVSAGLRAAIASIRNTPGGSNPAARAELKYYLYLSNAKVDMLYSQVGSEEAARTQKLKVVLDYLERAGAIGTVDEPQQYFRARMEVEWGETHGIGRGGRPYIYFAGATERTSFLLSASKQYLVGGHVPPVAGFSSSSVPRVIDTLIGEIAVASGGDPGEEQKRLHADPDGQERALRLVEEAPLHLSSQRQMLEFVAKRLLHGPSPGYEGRMSLLGTPLYVALVF